MDERRRLQLIKLIIGLIFVLLVLLFNNVKAEKERLNNHENILWDLADQEVDDLYENEGIIEEQKHWQLLNRMSVNGKETEERFNDLADNISDDDITQYGDELVVEDDDDLHDELEPLYVGSEDYDEVYKTRDYEELPHCQEDVAVHDKPRPTVVVSTLDGSVTSLDMLTGAVLWSHRTGGKTKNMLTSSMSKLEVTSRGEWVRLIPSLDGGIFRFDGDAVEALPVTAETLLHSSFKFNSDTIFTGGKSTELWGMALDSGKLIYVCNSSGCKRQRTAAKPTHMLVVKRVTQTVRAVDPKSGDERWNFSVGQHEVNVAGGGCDWAEPADVIWEDLPLLHFIIPEGVVMGVDSQNQLMWQQKLTSPVVGAWKVIKGELEQIDLFSTNSVPALTPDKDISESEYRSQGKEEQQQPALYVGVHQKQLYIQQSGGMRNKVNTAFRVFSTGFSDEVGSSKEVAFPRVHWRPYLATALSRTPVVNFNERKHPLLINYEGREEVTAVAVPHQIDYPFDNGYFLYADEGSGQLNFSGPWEAPIIEEDTIIEEVTSHIVRICFQFGPHFWIYVLGGVIFYVALHYLVLKWFIEQMRRHVTNQAVAFINMALHHVLANNPHILAIIQRIGVQIPPLPAPPPSTQEEVASLPSNSNGEDSQKCDSTSQFTSRYQTDFEPITCLGRGGFGVVFQVYNKLDENEYAVKRITLPSKEASSERVKREVRALAKLNHTNIVRYYNSWLESPPVGWQDKIEAQWKNGDALSNTVFTPEYEETQERGQDDGIGSQITDKNSLSGVLKKLGQGPVTFDSDELFSKCQNISTDRSNDDDSDSDDSKSCVEYCKGSSSANVNDDSLDIVFENSVGTANLSTNKNMPEDSFEILFEHSEKVSDTKYNNNDDIAMDTKILSGDIDSLSLECNKSQSVAFLNTSVNSDSVQSTPNVVTDYSSHLKCSPNKSEDNFLSDSNVKRRRVQSQPPLNNHQGGDERPRTLSLGTNVEGTSSKIWTGAPVPKTFMYIQMELCQKESLRDWLLKNCKSRPKKIILNMFNDIVRAVEYVHDNQLMHRDLKPSNIFFSLDNEIKIGDFGLVTQITEGEQEVRTPAETVPSVYPGHRHTHRVGTQLYMSPEQVSNQSYDYKVDIYSLGLIFFEMLVPFSTGMERLSVMSNLREGNFPDGFCDRFSHEAELLKLMLSTNPANRPTTRGIRARNPLRPLQGSAVDDILPEEHFRLNRQRSHTRSHSGSSFSFTSSTSSL